MIAITWILFISVVFTLPQLNPVNSQTLNYTIVAVGVVMTYSLSFWLVGISAGAPIISSSDAFLALGSQMVHRTTEADRRYGRKMTHHHTHHRRS
jgi:hypothetical protein